MLAPVLALALAPVVLVLVLVVVVATAVSGGEERDGEATAETAQEEAQAARRRGCDGARELMCWPRQ